MTATPQHAGVIAPPPLLLLLAVLAGLVLSWLAPLGLLAQIPPLFRYLGGGALIVASLALAFAAWRLFRIAGTDVRPWKPTTHLVRAGVFDRVRNPMYVAMVILALGIALAAAADWLVAATAALALVLHYGVVVREEAYLDALFGEEYRAYKARTPRYGWRL